MSMYKWLLDIILGRLLIFHFDKGDGGQSAPAPSSQTVTQTNLPEYAQPYVTSLFGRAQDVSNLPYPQYTGPLVQGLTGNQQQAVGMAATNAGNPPPAIGQAQNMLGSVYNNAQQAGNINLPQVNPTPVNSYSFDNTAAQQYMNPYQQNVTDIQKREAARQAGIQHVNTDSQAQQAGAFGGYRHGIVDAEAQRNLGQLLNDIQEKGSNAAYTNAQGQFNADRGADIQAKEYTGGQNLTAQQSNAQNALGLGQLGLQGEQTALQAGQGTAQIGALQQDIGNQGIANLLQTGGLQQQTGQQGLTTAYQQFLNKQSYPMQQLNQLSGILHGVPITASSDVTQYNAAPSTASQVAGLGLGAAGLSKLFSGS